MRNYFQITEFLVDSEMREPHSLIPVHVVQKIDRYHRPILNDIRDALGCPVYISDHSGYRPVEWEKKRGRSGDSEHCFKGNGAVDVTCKAMRLADLLDMLHESDYRRICYYPHLNFIHADFKGTNKLYYEADQNGTWKFKGER